MLPSCPPRAELPDPRLGDAKLVGRVRCRHERLLRVEEHQLSGHDANLLEAQLRAAVDLTRLDTTRQQGYYSVVEVSDGPVREGTAHDHTEHVLWAP